MCQSKEQGGRRCPGSSGSKANTLNAINKRLRRVNAKIEGGATGEGLRALEEKRDGILREKEDVFTHFSKSADEGSTSVEETDAGEGSLHNDAASEEDYSDATYDARGFDTSGVHRSGYEFDPETGLDVDGYDYNGFDSGGIHRETGDTYDEEGIDSEGYDRYGEYDPNFFKPTFEEVDIDDVEVDVPTDEIDLGEADDFR